MNMSNESWINYKEEVRERLRQFTLKILELSEKLPKSPRGKVINYQLTKSGSSMYINYRSALRSRSKAEFFSKLSIAVEEADETEGWIEITISSGILEDDFIKELHKESLELLKILSSMRRRSSV
ncbi:MAG: four helix bundle protein [Bacteroidales bacterium]|nr:four helix bundle protein [Bacteroidales bacterium]